MEYLKKIFVGFLYGVGFSSGVVLVGYLYPGQDTPGAEVVAVDSFEERNREMEAKRQEKLQAMSKISIEDRGMNMSATGPEYMLTMRNDSTFKFTWVFPVVDLFDAADLFLYRCAGGGTNPLPPGATQHAKVVCHNLRRDIIEKVARHEIRIDRAD